MNLNDQMNENIANPHELEKIYRRDPEAFKNSFASVWEQNPESQALAVWHERLNYSDDTRAGKAFFLSIPLLYVGLFAMLAGVTMRVIMHFVEQELIAPINLVFGIAPFIVAYFLYRNPPQKKVTFLIATIFVISGIYLNVLPLAYTDSIMLAYLHAPIFLWIVVGLAYTGNAYKLGSTRLAYLKFNGEFAILYAIMAISGMVLTALTIQLFNMVDMDITQFYFENIVLIGAVSLAIVATYMVTSNLNLAKHIAPYIARIFSPLVLVTLVVYLITVLWMGRNPFMDRDFLLSFNAVLLIVLVVTIFSITESNTDDKKNISDYIHCALIVLALIIDSVALSAIVFRLSEYGITPNRLAVLGANLLIWANLIWIMMSYMRFLQNKAGSSTIQDAVTKYLPVYGLWAVFVTFTFPLLFS